MLLLLLPPLLLKLSQCFCIADHTLNSSNYRMEGGGMYLGVWMSVRVCVSAVWVCVLWCGFIQCVLLNIKSTYLFWTMLMLSCVCYFNSHYFYQTETQFLSPANRSSRHSSSSFITNSATVWPNDTKHSVYVQHLTRNEK